MGIKDPKPPVPFSALRCLNINKRQERNCALEQTGQLMTLALFICSVEIHGKHFPQTFGDHDLYFNQILKETINMAI